MMILSEEEILLAGIHVSYTGTQSHGGSRDNHSGALIFRPLTAQTKLEKELEEVRAMKAELQDQIDEVRSIKEDLLNK